MITDRFRLLEVAHSEPRNILSYLYERYREILCSKIPVFLTESNERNMENCPDSSVDFNVPVYYTTLQ